MISDLNKKQYCAAKHYKKCHPDPEDSGEGSHERTSYEL